MIPVRREVKRNFSDFSLLDNVVGGENSSYSRREKRDLDCELSSR